MSSDGIAPQGYRIYPGSVPEFRLVKKSDGTIEQQVRYINTPQGYVGKWMKVQVVKEDTNGN